MAGNESFLDLAAAIVDGTPVDWDSAARVVASEEDRRLLDELRFIANAVVQSHHSLPAIASQPEDTDPGREWGGLRIVEHIGRGSFGDVYRAWDPRLAREVALKLLRRDLRGQGVTDLAHEGRLLARVNHPNIVTVYGAESIDGHVGIWMELVQGTTLAHQIASSGPISSTEAIAIGVTLADALAAVHRAGLVHRDVKPQNIIRADAGRLILTDFGAGCAFRDELDAATRELAGTPLYLAPEILEGERATPNSDVYSLGVLLYYSVTGQYPVRGQTLHELRAAHRHKIRTPLRAAAPTLPVRFTQVIDRAIAAEPERRFESATALRDALAALSPPPQARRLLTWLLAAALASAIAAGIFLVSQSSPATSIAVLPMTSQSATPEGQELADGFVSELTRTLAEIDGLDVRPRPSPFAVRAASQDTAALGRLLRANYLLRGTSSENSDQWRIEVELVRTSDGTRVWARTFDRGVTEAFLIREEIARAIAHELQLPPPLRRRVGAVDPAAYGLFLKARALTDAHRGAAALRRAITLYEQSLKADRSFAAAHAGLADAWALMSLNYGGVSPAEAQTHMRDAAHRALAIDPTLAEAHAAMGIALAREQRWHEAESSFRTALKLNRGIPSIYVSYAIAALFPQGKMREALEVLTHAVAIDPLSHEARRMLVWVQISTGHYNAAIELCRQILADDPNDLHTRQVLGRALFHTGAHADAIAIFEKQGTPSRGFLGYAYAVTGRVAEAREIAAADAAFPARQALTFAGLGAAEEAFAALDRMAEAGDPRAGIYFTYPEFVGLRDHPRFAALRRRHQPPR